MASSMVSTLGDHLFEIALDFLAPLHQLRAVDRLGRAGALSEPDETSTAASVFRLTAGRKIMVV